MSKYCILGCWAALTTMRLWVFNSVSSQPRWLFYILIAVTCRRTLLCSTRAQDLAGRNPPLKFTLVQIFGILLSARQKSSPSASCSIFSSTSLLKNDLSKENLGKSTEYIYGIHPDGGTVRFRREWKFDFAHSTGTFQFRG